MTSSNYPPTTDAPQPSRAASPGVSWAIALCLAPALLLNSFCLLIEETQIPHEPSTAAELLSALFSTSLSVLAIVFSFPYWISFRRPAPSRGWGITRYVIAAFPIPLAVGTTVVIGASIVACIVKPGCPLL